MANGGISDSIHTFHNCVECRVVADCRIGSIQVIVDCSRQSYATDIIFFSKYFGTCQRTVTSDYDQCVYVIAAHILVCFLPAFRGLKLAASCSTEDCTATIDYATYVFCREIFYLVVNQAIITTEDSFDFKTIADTGTCHGTYSSIHTRSVAS